MPSKFDLICGYPIDKVVEIVDDYKQGKLIYLSGLKAGYKDYVVYKRSWLKEHLDMEYHLLGGKAIPVEWIKNWDASPIQWIGDKHIDESELHRYIVEMLEQWKKENGKLV